MYGAMIDGTDWALFMHGIWCHDQTDYSVSDVISICIYNNDKEYGTLNFIRYRRCLSSPRIHPLLHCLSQTLSNCSPF